ncbi:cytochrome b/b6 domain-containing protein [Parvularcula sp. LCG005]|uniref:cytochrome b/b6 domain-containing protein n=1 Tax=Parvularcula sp. LCG005 TaxID=3078805 RepID=UPI0029433C90|nr:cytochrome b/b6 domain-containing protein [Parvularcula sp. LCG005]WOI54608.1 cytochrome b/b6 domain-containing protein [Parvularcula sp. LCG005]
MSATDDRTYSTTARTLHWLIAFLILAQVGGGLFMHRMDLSDAKFQMYQLHKSFGLVVLGLSLFRLYWRLRHPTPALPAHMRPWERLLAKGTHWAFYGLMIGVPLIGWLMISADPLSQAVPLKLFFILPLPLLPVPMNEGLAEILSGLHEFFAFATLGLLALHIAAALKHHVKDGDDVLISMAPGTTKGRRFSVVAWIVWGIIGLTALGATVIGLSGGDDDHKPMTAEAVAELSGATPASDTAAADPDAWVVDMPASRLEFIFTQSGQEVVGRFNTFDAIIKLDPTAPETGEINVQIDLLSADAGTSDRNGTLQQSAWFDSANEPQAQFTSTDIRATGEGEYVAEGTLSLKGTERAVSLPFTLSVDGDRAVAHGMTTLNRLDFGVGEGAMVSEKDVPPSVGVRIHIEAERP